MKHQMQMKGRHATERTLDHRELIFSRGLREEHWLDDIFPDNEFRAPVVRGMSQFTQAIRSRNFDLILILAEDLKNGALVDIRDIRYITDKPVFLILRENNQDLEIAALQIGVDSIFSLDRERPILILEKIRSLQRYVVRRGAANMDSRMMIQHGDMIIKPESHEVFWRGSPVPLTRSEFLALRLLVERPMVVFSRRNIQDAVCMDNLDAADRTVDSHIKRIRQKFRRVDSEFESIETIYGVGYRFRIMAKDGLLGSVTLRSAA